MSGKVSMPTPAKKAESTGDALKGLSDYLMQRRLNKHANNISKTVKALKEDESKKS